MDVNLPIEKKISVLMPVFNGLPLIKASVQSILAQSYSNWECIIVDDGSTDGTSDYLDSLTDPRFIVCHFDKNKGRPTAREKTLELSTGEYVAFLDAGDMYAKDNLMLQAGCLGNHPDVCLVASAICSFGTGTSLKRCRGVSRMQKRVFDGSHYPNFAASMLWGEKARRVHFDERMLLGEDRDYLERYLSGESFLEVPDVLYYYSEFDSVGKKKILKTYWLNIRKYARITDWKHMALYLLKYIYASVVYPFVPIDRILMRRGRPLTDGEQERFQRDCIPLLDSALQ